MRISTLLITLFIASASFAQTASQWVNPFIGSSNFGTTNPGAIAPQGMVSVVPFNVTGSSVNTWDKDAQWWSTPYSADNTFFTGYSHVNLSGVGCPDLGVVLVMPTTGEVNPHIKEYGSVMSNQQASPGLYSCHLDKYDVDTKVTATQRSGLSKFTFPAGKSNILIDLGNGLTNESGGYLKVVNEQEVEGWRMTGNFCYNATAERPVYFVARFNKKPSNFGLWKKMPKMSGPEASWSGYSDKFNYYDRTMQPMAGDSIGAYFTFETTEREEVMVQVGISYVSIENARMNLETEQNGFDFDNTYNKTASTWEELLSRVNVKGGTKDEKQVFYTGLYHLHIHPNVINDVNGEYPMMDRHEIGRNENRDRYTIYSLWDTYRNYHPLMSLVYPELQLDFVHTMIDMYKESGWLPKWELNGRETFTMNGDPAFPVIADTYLRGLTDFDVETAYEAMIKHATTPGKENKIRTTNDFYVEHGYVPLRTQYDNSTSVGLELYIADWNLGQLAKALGKTEDYKRYNDQSMQYVNYFDKKDTKLIRPKNVDGTFYTPFDPEEGENFAPVPGFHEGTAWQYTFCVQHDLLGLAKLMGGKKAFASKLEHVFEDDLFDMGNEPDIHYPYLFNLVKGQEWRAQDHVTRLLKENFKNIPGGLPGNDDCGTMSAWAVYSMMGFYPICPGGMEYAIVQPTFDEVTIKLDQNYYKGAEISIVKEKSGDGKYIQTIENNNKKLKGFFIDHNELVNGANLEIKVGK